MRVIIIIREIIKNGEKRLTDRPSCGKVYTHLRGVIFLEEEKNARKDYTGLHRMQTTQL